MDLITYLSLTWVIEAEWRIYASVKRWSFCLGLNVLTSYEASSHMRPNLGLKTNKVCHQVIFHNDCLWHKVSLFSVIQVKLHSRNHLNKSCHSRIHDLCSMLCALSAYLLKTWIHLSILHGQYLQNTEKDVMRMTPHKINFHIPSSMSGEIACGLRTLNRGSRDYDPSHKSTAANLTTYSTNIPQCTIL